MAEALLKFFCALVDLVQDLFGRCIVCKLSAKFVATSQCLVSCRYVFPSSLSFTSFDLSNSKAK